MGPFMAARSAITRSNRDFPGPEPPPKRLLYVEPLLRRMRVRLARNWIGDSENDLLPFEPGRYPMGVSLETDVSPNSLQTSEHASRHPDPGLTSWFTVRWGQ